jgi:hypothetical protein
MTPAYQDRISVSCVLYARKNMSEQPNPFGKVYTPRELAELWKLSENSVRRLFQDQSGVFVMGDSNPRGKRGYSTLRIPQSVAERVFRARVTK